MVSGAPPPSSFLSRCLTFSRSKGLSLLVLPTTTKYFDSALHSITTQCSVRHGLFNLGAEDLDIQRFADFLVQPDTIHNGVGDLFNAASWKHTHQITRFGKWDVMPFSLALTINSQISFFNLSLRHNLPKPNTFGDNCLALVVNDILYATFPYPTLSSSPPSSHLHPSLALISFDVPLTDRDTNTLAKQPRIRPRQLASHFEQLHELVTFPPLDMARAFYMPLSSPRGLFSELLKVPFYRIPKTLGWPFLDSPMPSFTPPPVSLQPLHNLLSLFPP